MLLLVQARVKMQVQMVVLAVQDFLRLPQLRLAAQVILVEVRHLLVIHRIMEVTEQVEHLLSFAKVHCLVLVQLQQMALLEELMLVLLAVAQVVVLLPCLLVLTRARLHRRPMREVTEVRVRRVNYSSKFFYITNKFLIIRS